MAWKWLKKVKDVYSWYSFASGIAGLTGISLIVSPVVALVVGVVGAAIKGVPWPITLMAGFCTLVAVIYLIALPIFIKSAIHSASPNIADEPIRPHWEAWKHVEKFTVREAAYLLMNLDPSTHSKDPKIDAWMKALRAAIRTGDLDFINATKPGMVSIGSLREYPSESTEIPKLALIDFAKRNNIDLKYLGQWLGA
jgi:hypothetical protein